MNGALLETPQKQRPTFWRSGCTLRGTALGQPITCSTESRRNVGCLRTTLASGARPEIAPDARAWTVGRYLVLYREQDDGIEVVRVVHGARRVEQIDF